ncbi:MAG: zinc transporter [Legionellales bacterium]|nr:zinc transporter [Legionellales bacterium]
MDLTLLKASSALVILLMTIGAAWLPFAKRINRQTGHKFSTGEALASGIFLGVGLLHMLSEAHQDFTALGIHYPLAFLLAGVMFLTLLLFEHIGMELNKQQTATPAIALVALFMLATHSLLEGTALGIANSTPEVIIILIAIIAHKWAASFSLAVKLNQSTFSIYQAIAWFILFAAMTPVGILLATLIASHTDHYSLTIPVLNSLAAGTFIYIGTLHGLKRSVMIEHCCNMKEFTWMFAGFAFIALANVWDLH